VNCAIILAAGKGKRFGGDKLFATLAGKPLLYHCLRTFEDSPVVGSVCIPTNSRNKKKVVELVKKWRFSKVQAILNGGKTRYASVAVGVKNSPANTSLFIIHNAANPLVSHEEIEACVKVVHGEIKGAAVGRPVEQTLKRILRGRVVKTIERKDAWEMETPQVVDAEIFRAALEKFPPSSFYFTDDISVLEKCGLKTVVVPASDANRKITTPHDLAVAELSVGAPDGHNAMQNMRDLPANFHVGIGEDGHSFEQPSRPTRGAKKSLILGGVKIPNMPALVANSDGDVLLHALCNAISSALGEGSLGTYATKMCRNGEGKSTAYLAHVLTRIHKKGYKMHNCAISFEAAKPKIDPLVLRLRKSLATLLSLPEAAIGITATSGEKLTSFGRGEGIACRAVVLLLKS